MKETITNSKKAYIAPTASIVIIEMQHLMAGSTSAKASDVQDLLHTGSNVDFGSSSAKGSYFDGDIDF